MRTFIKCAYRDMCIKMNKDSDSFTCLSPGQCLDYGCLIWEDYKENRKNELRTRKKLRKISPRL